MALTLYTFAAGTKIESAKVNSNFSSINTALFNLDQANFNPAAQLPDTLLAVIATGGKVNGSAMIAQTIDAVKGQFVWAVGGTLSTGVDKSFHYRSSAVLTIIGVRLEVKTAPTGAAIIVDINKNDATGATGTLFNTTKPQIAAGATTGGGGAVLTTTNLADNDLLTIDIDQVGSGTAGADLSVMLLCEQKVPQ